MTDFAGNQTVIEIIYLVASVLFILSLKFMSSPATARYGVWAGEVGMLLAICGTLLHHGIVDFKWIIIGLVLGSGIGIPLGLVQMTAVPQRTALSHAFGALCVTLVGTAEYYLRSPDVPRFMMGVLSFEVILGGLTFTGSLMAAGKLEEVLPQRPLIYKGQNLVNFLLMGIAVAVAVYLVLNPGARELFPVMLGLALIFGVLLVIPIGGADMPTVISLLNSYAGLSAAAMGFVLGSKLLIIAGALDGSSGLILSVIMSKAMNRSFANVLFGAFGQVQQVAAGAQEAKPVRTATPEESAYPPWRRCSLCHSSGSRAHARAHERPARRSRHPVRPADRHGRDQWRLPANRCRPGDRSQRCHQSCRTQRSFQSHLRHADP